MNLLIDLYLLGKYFLISKYDLPNGLKEEKVSSQKNADDQFSIQINI